MRRVPAALLGALLLMAGAVILLWRWQAVGFSPVLAVTGLLCLVGLPGGLWLLLGRRPSVARLMPRTFWVGLALILVGLIWVLLGITAGAAGGQTLGVSSSTPGQRLRFVRLPSAVVGRLKVLFPNLIVGRTLRLVGLAKVGPVYEIWLRRPGMRTYALQVSWMNGQVQVENQGLNTLYYPREGTPLSLSTLRGRLHFSAPVYGPVVFPGYVLFVSLSKDAAFAIDRLSGNVANAQGW